jgi:hypothetical protein
MFVRKSSAFPAQNEQKKNEILEKSGVQIQFAGYFCAASLALKQPLFCAAGKNALPPPRFSFSVPTTKGMNARPPARLSPAEAKSASSSC